jgi:hypothetical protein
MRPFARAVAVAALVAGIGAAAPTASAKMIVDHVTITGPGISEPVRIAGDSQDAFVLMDVTGYNRLAYDSDSSRVERSSPTVDLGPRYDVTYVQPVVVLPGTRDARISVVQYVYPLAQPDPVAYMPNGQRGTTANGGWFVADDGLYRELQRLEVLPQPAPATRTDQVVQDPRPLNWAAMAVLAAAIIAALSIVTARAR